MQGVLTSESSLASDPAPGGRWRAALVFPGAMTRRHFAVLILGLLLVIGLADFLLGFELSMLVFYILPVCVAVATAGWRLGVLTSVVSVATWLAGDLAAGAHFSTWLVPVANALFALATYLIVVWLLHNLVTLQRDLEERVHQRTEALQRVIAERERLEKAILEIGERERRSIGQDLHDGLGQHLTGTALAGQVTVERLRAQKLHDEAEAVRKLVGLVEQAIDMTRHTAKGLLLAEITPEGFFPALQELAADASDEARMHCDLLSDGTGAPGDTTAATHLFHLAKEAVHNAIHHGRARRISITWRTDSGRPELVIADDGIGLPPPDRRGQGLGLSIMAHRAEIIGWQFEIHAAAGGGTLARCRPATAASPHG